MPLEAGVFDDLCDETVTTRPRTTSGARRDVEYAGAPSTWQVRVQRRPHKIRNAQGEEILAAGVVYFMEDPGLAIGDELTLPEGETPIVLAITSPRYVPAGDGAYYVGVFYG